MRRRNFLLQLAGSASLVGCGSAPVQQVLQSTPAAPNSSAYALTSSPEGRAYLVWIETAGDSHSLRLSSLDGDSWTPARTIESGGAEWFVNWADHPMIVAGPGGRLMASRPFRPESAQGSTWGLTTRLLFSPDEGETWETACDFGPDNTDDYDGFIGFWAGTDSFRAAYLSPLLKGEAQRGMAHVKTLRFADFSLDGKLLSDQLVDEDVCTCCPLAMTVAKEGPIVVYRDHKAGEIRDISVVRRLGDKWTEPQSVHDDLWNINGCPSNGAAVEADRDRVAVAWFTAADGVPRVRLALSSDSGQTFDKPISIDDGAPAGWAAVVLLQDGRVAVSWLERRVGQDGVGDVKLRLVDPDGTTHGSRIVATSSSGRATGIPQMVRSGDRLVLAWRQDGQVQTQLLPLAELS